MVKDENTRATVIMSKELKERLNELAKKDMRTFSSLVNKVLQDYADNNPK